MTKSLNQSPVYHNKKTLKENHPNKLREQKKPKQKNELGFGYTRMSLPHSQLLDPPKSHERASPKLPHAQLMR